MPYNILHVTPYMHASAGGPPVVVENFIAEASRLGHWSEIVSTFAFCNGDDSNLRSRLEQLAPTTFLTGLETVPFVSRSGAEKINAHVRRADIVHVHTLWSPLNVAARYACRKHDKPYVLMPHGMLDPYSLSLKALKKSVYLKFFEGPNMACAQRMIYTTSEDGETSSAGRPAFATRGNCATWRAGKLDLDKRPPASVSEELPSSRREADVTISRTTSSQERS